MQTDTDPSMFRVTAMHERFKINYDGPPRLLSPEEKQFRVSCLQEELDEYKNAGTLVEQYDALLDMAVFLLGTFHRQGMPFSSGMQVVISHNMLKTVGPNSKRGGFSIDLVKPPHWVGPENVLAKLLKDAADGQA
jgi:predicted HAD superfamily Cof-like phosphohydrolase